MSVSAPMVSRWIFAGWLLFITVGRAQSGFESAGGRFGFSLTDPAQHFHQVEAFLNCNLPWRWHLGTNWFVQTRGDLSGGWLTDGGTHAAMGTLGPSALLGHEHWRFSFEAGSSPTLISRHHFPEKNLGGAFQFTSHLGVNFDFSAHIRAGYRFSHMSNAGLSTPNPGLNMHFFTLSYLFGTAKKQTSAD
jgi:lipid A 3-O-deacylase